MGCHCRRAWLGPVVLACPGAGKGQLLKGLAPSLHHTQQVREDKEQNRQQNAAAALQAVRGWVVHRAFAPLWELPGGGKRRTVLSVPGKGMAACSPHTSFPVLQDTPLGLSPNVQPERIRRNRTRSEAAMHCSGSSRIQKSV